MQANNLTIVVPCYNEEEVLHETNKQLTELMKKMVDRNLIIDTSRIIYVDDGSKDKTWEIINELGKTFPFSTGVKLSRNFGHQGALIAGVSTAVESSDCVVTVDADLQDDITVIENFVEEFDKGYDVVYGVRNKRDTDTAFKRGTARMFYKLMGKLGVNLVPDHADFRLLSKRAAKTFLSFKEENMFIRGIIPLVGFPSTKVYYDRKERFAGESKYPLKKMLSFAIDGITSFSIAPIRIILNLGILCVFIGIIMAIYSLVQKFQGATIQGWTSLILSLWLLGGVQLIAISVVGEYVGKIFTEVKHRPRFIIEKDTYTKTEQDD